jgi:hypothetical protein
VYGDGDGYGVERRDHAVGAGELHGVADVGLVWELGQLHPRHDRDDWGRVVRGVVYAVGGRPVHGHR